MNSMEQMYQAALRLPEPRLLAILRGQDNGLPQAVAEAALRMRKRMQQNAIAQQAMAQQGEPTQKDKLLAEYGGIANLPAELDMSGEAQRGIASFAGGGEVQRYQAGGRTMIPGDSFVREGMYGYETDPARMSAMDRYFYGQRSLTGDPTLEEARARKIAELRAIEAARGESMRRRLTGAQVDPVTKGIAPTTKAVRPGGEFDYVPNVNAPVSTETAEAVERERVLREAREDLARSESAAAKASGVGIGALQPRPKAPVERDAPVYKDAPQAPTAISTEDQIRDAKKWMDASGVKKGERPEFYIEEARALGDKYGVNRDPYAKLRERLEREDAREGERRSKADTNAMISAGLAMIGSRSQYPTVAFGNAAGSAFKERNAELKEIDRASMERAKALADIEKANSDIARGEVKEGLARRDAADTRHDNALNKAFEVAQKSAEARDRLAGTIFNVESQTVASQNTELGNTFRVLMQADSQRYATDTQYAASINAAMISANAQLAAANLRTAQPNKVLEVMKEAHRSVIAEIGETKASMLGVADLQRRVQQRFVEMYPMYSNPERFLLQNPLDGGIGAFGKPGPGDVKLLNNK